MNAGEREGYEQAEAEARSSPSGTVVYKAILKEGFEELDRPSSALFWSGLAAGLSMGGSLIAEGLLASHLPDTTWKPLITKLGYSLGFVVVILGRQQLFTENTLTPILPLMREKTLSRFANVMRLWFVVLFANLLGCLAAAWVASRGAAFSEGVRHEFTEIGRQAMEGSFGVHVTHGIFAGWLIALMVWVLPFAESARFWVIIMLSYIVGLGHFGHVVAGGVQTFYMAVVGGHRGERFAEIIFCRPSSEMSSAAWRWWRQSITRRWCQEKGPKSEAITPLNRTVARTYCS